MHEHSSGRRFGLPARRAGKLAVAVGVCLCAGQLVATAPALAGPAPTTAVLTSTAPVTGALTPAVAATQAAAVSPRLSLTLSTHKVSWGSSVRLTGKVTDPATGKPVTAGTITVQKWQNGAWRTSQAKRVYSTGQVSFTSRPTVNTTYRLVFGGLAPAYTSRASGSARVVVTASGAKIISQARKLTGSPYRSGAAGPHRFDCSGLTQYVYRKAAGRKLPHRANSQQHYGKAIARGKARPGDLIIFRSGSYGYHAAIYAGGGYMYDAPGTGRKVGKHKIWSRNYVVRRLV